MLKSSLLIFLTLTAYASAGVIDYHNSARGLSTHHGLAARKAAAVPRLSRRRESMRCKTRDAQVSISVDIPAPEPTSSKEDEPEPETTTTEKPKPTTTKEETPEPTTTKEETPEPTTTKEETPEPTTTKEETPEPTGGSGGGDGGFMSGTNEGQGTFYATGLTACGETNSDDEYITAVAIGLFNDYPGYDGANPNNNPICGKKIKATYEGKSVTVRVTDACMGCAYTDLDLTPSAFSQIADQALGRISGVTWSWA